MPILDEEIVWCPAALNSDALPAQNGGRMRFTTLVSGVKNNLFPDVSQSDRMGRRRDLAQGLHPSRERTRQCLVECSFVPGWADAGRRLRADLSGHGERHG